MKGSLDSFFAGTPGEYKILSTFDGDYTLNDLLNEVEHLTGFLKKKLDVKGLKIALLVPGVFPFLALSIAINRLGGTIIPISLQYRREDLRALLAYLEADAVFTIREHQGFSFATMVEQWAGSSGNRTTVFKTDDCSEWTQQIFFEDRERLIEENLPDMIFCTSGSTGTPKGLSVDISIFSFPLMVDMLKLESQDRIFVNSPFASIPGFATIISALQVGYTVVYPEAFDILRMVRLLERTSCNKVLSTPSIFKAIYAFAAQSSPEAIGQIEWCGLAGEMIPDRYTESFPLMTETRFVGIYGCSEVGGVLQRDLRLESAWSICDGVAAEIDEINGVGELLVRSPFMFTEYYRQPDLTREVLTKDHWFRTGDLVKPADGGRITIAGRKKDLIKKGGQQVVPGEVEQILGSHPNVKQAVVFGAPHPVFGEQIVALVVAEGSLSSDQLYPYCRERIAGFKVPDDIELIKEIPTIQGKADKLTLRNQYIQKREVSQS
jgi:acyl-coenzyme A synthetase/AMP-(fatty) acid ligase